MSGDMTKIGIILARGATRLLAMVAVSLTVHTVVTVVIDRAGPSWLATASAWADDDDDVPAPPPPPPPPPGAPPAPPPPPAAAAGVVRDAFDSANRPDRQGERVTLLECYKEVLLLPPWLRQECDRALERAARAARRGTAAQGN